MSLASCKASFIWDRNNQLSFGEKENKKEKEKEKKKEVKETNSESQE